MDARTKPEDVVESVAELWIHPAVDDGIVATAAHGQPVAADPDGLDVAEFPDVWMGVADQSDGVNRKPTDGVYHDDCYHHLHHLIKNNCNCHSGSLLWRRRLMHSTSANEEQQQLFNQAIIKL